MRINNDSYRAFLQHDVLASASDGAVANVQNTFNNFSSNNTVALKFTADNDAGTATVSTVYALGGRGDSAKKTLPAGVTLSGDYTSIANWLDYANNVGLSIKAIILQTDNTANFSTQLEMADATPNQLNQGIKRIELTDYRQPTGNGYSDTLSIKDRPFVALAQTWLRFSLIKNSYVKVTFVIDRAEVTAALTPVSF